MSSLPPNTPQHPKSSAPTTVNQCKHSEATLSFSLIVDRVAASVSIVVSLLTVLVEFGDSLELLVGS